MTVKSYFLLLDVGNGKRQEIADVLRDNAGVVIAAPLQGSKDIIMAVETPENNQAMILANEAIASLYPMIDRVNLLPVQRF